MSALFRGITSKHDADFYCLNCFHSFRSENKLKNHKNVCENHAYCYEEMPKEDKKILKYNHGEKSMKVQFIIYADLESFLQKMNTCHNNPKKSLVMYPLVIHCLHVAHLIQQKISLIIIETKIV